VFGTAIIVACEKKIMYTITIDSITVKMTDFIIYAVMNSGKRVNCNILFNKIL
jgi:hypothetical protein